MRRSSDLCAWLGDDFADTALDGAAWNVHQCGQPPPPQTPPQNHLGRGQFPFQPVQQLLAHMYLHVNTSCIGLRGLCIWTGKRIRTACPEHVDAVLLQALILRRPRTAEVLSLLLHCSVLCYSSAAAR